MAERNDSTKKRLPSTNSDRGKDDESNSQPPTASVFGDDDRHFNLEKLRDADRGSKHNGEVAESQTPNFGKATFSRSVPGISHKVLAERQSSVIPDTDKDSSERSGEPDDQTSPSSSDSSEQEFVPRGWVQFAQSRFQTKGCYSYCCTALPQPLLPKYEKSDHLAALAAWVTVLRIMGDLPDTDFGERLTVAGSRSSSVYKIKGWFQKKFTKKDVEDAQKKYSELFKDPSSSEINDIPFLPDNRDTMLEKVQYLCSLGIFKADIRDELYCQLCRQLTNNPSRNSTIRGWVLLTLFAGSFAPTERFGPCFLQFLQDAPTEFAFRVERLLRRTFVCGTRGFPPSWLEFQASKNGKPILLPITLMNSTRMLIEADSVTTVQELCMQIASRIGLEESDGFSVYITLFHKISCLGDGHHRIMDAVSECEQHTKQMGMRESSSAWRLYFRKEYFTPWHNATEDAMATDLIYQQVMRGISVGEYKCEKEDVLVLMAAQRYYLEYSENINDAKLDQFLLSWLPKDQIKGKDVSTWKTNVKQALQNNFQDSKTNAQSLKSDIVTFAKDKWFLLFSRFYDAGKVQTPDVTWTNIVIGVNCKGFYVTDESENIKLHLPFTEISEIRRGKQTMTISTVRLEDYTVQSPHNEDMTSVLQSFHMGLVKRSKYALALQDTAPLENAIGIELAKGDLVTLERPYGEMEYADVFGGTCQRTGKKGDAPRDILYIIPIVENPPANVMGMLKMQMKKDTSGFQGVINKHLEQHTLQTFARIHFRQLNENRMSKMLSKASFKKDKSAASWEFAKDPIKKPLLRRCGTDDSRRVACRTFLDILYFITTNQTMQYMGDASSRDQTPSIEIANESIIDPALRSRQIRDEVFTQIIKQITNNPKSSSEERGWVLLALLCTCTSPGIELYDELERFLASSRKPRSGTCLKRLSITKIRGPRQYPPHQMEHESIMKGRDVTDLPVLFPDHSREEVQIPFHCRVYHIRRKISDKLKLKFPDEYGLFFGLRDKVVAASDHEYFFDALTRVERIWLLKKQSGDKQIETSQQRGPVVFFMKKLWLNAHPGIDKTADRLFHYPQEVPNYLRGYHKCSNDEAAKLAAYIYRVKFGKGATFSGPFGDIMPSLIPKPILGSWSIEAWEKAVTINLDDTKGLSEEEAKSVFLKIASHWPTYGSMFFEVKQRGMKRYPKHIILSINPLGVSFIHPDSKDVIVTFQFNKIPNWAFDGRSFTLVVGETNNSQKIYLETNVGHNIDDFVMSYVSRMMDSHIRRRTSYTGVTIGETAC
ncbi:hypothetical protein ScPMuIL_017427 [Solemya velum]